MDDWSEEQLRKMEVGGNENATIFFESEEVPITTPIRVKYNTEAAKMYKEKISALAEGRAWTRPAGVAKGLGSNQLNLAPSKATAFDQTFGRGGGAEPAAKPQTNARAISSDAYFGNPEPKKEEAGGGWFGGYVNLEKVASVAKSAVVSTVATTTSLATSAAAKVNEQTKDLRTNLADKDLVKNVGETTQKGWSTFTSVLGKAVVATTELGKSLVQDQPGVMEQTAPSSAPAPGWANPLAKPSGDKEGWDSWDEGEQPAAEQWVEEASPPPPKRGAWDDWGDGEAEEEDVFDVPGAAPPTAAPKPGPSSNPNNSDTWNSAWDSW